MAAKVINFEEQSPDIIFEINGREYTYEYGSTELDDAARELQEKLKRINKDSQGVEYIKSIDEFIDACFGKGTADEIFEHYPRNILVRAMVVDGILDGVANSEQAALVDELATHFSSLKINDGAKH